MNSYVTDLIEKNGNEYQAVLNELVESVSGETEAEFSSEFLSSCLDTLTEHNAIVISEDISPNFPAIPPGFHEVYVRGKKANTPYAVDGYYFNQRDGYLELSLFINDSAENIVPVLNEISAEEVTKKLRHLYNFFFYSAVGYIGDKASPASAEFQLAGAIEENLKSIRSLKLYMVTPRILSAPVKYARSLRQDAQLGTEYEFTQVCIDLSYLTSIKQDEGAVDLDLYGMGGIEALKIPTDSDSYTCYLTYFSGNIIAELYSLYGTSLVQANVRAYLGQNKVNSGIRQTIQDEPQYFLAFNNGLVVFAERAEEAGSRIMRIENLQIVNGGQTCASVYSTWLSGSNLKGKNLSLKEGIHQKVREIKVPVKLIVFPSYQNKEQLQELQKKVSVAANSQNAIKFSDLSSKLPFHTEFKKICSDLISPQDQTRWFYENLRGSYKAETDKLKGKPQEKKIFEQRYPKSQLVTKNDIALACLSFDRDSCGAAKGAEASARIFNENVKDVRELTPKEVKECLCKHIIFKQITDILRCRKKEVGIPNPRIPIIYAIRVFQANFGSRLNYDEVWNLQRLPTGLTDILLELVIRCNNVIRQHMGSYMISQYGKRKECERNVDLFVKTDGLG
jgi:hypothetical protein